MLKCILKRFGIIIISRWKNILFRKTLNLTKSCKLFQPFCLIIRQSFKNFYHPRRKIVIQKQTQIGQLSALLFRSSNSNPKISIIQKERLSSRNKLKLANWTAFTLLTKQAKRRWPKKMEKMVWMVCWILGIFWLNFVSYAFELSNKIDRWSLQLSNSLIWRFNQMQKTFSRWQITVGWLKQKGFLYVFSFC